MEVPPPWATLPPRQDSSQWRAKEGKDPVRKELLYGLSATLLLISLTACGSSQAGQPNAPDPTPSSTQTTVPSMEPSASVPVQDTVAPIETVIPAPSPVMEDSTESSTAVPVTEPPTPATAAPVSTAPAATEPITPAAPSGTTAASTSEGSDTPKYNFETYPADPNISIPPDILYWESEYVGEIEGYYYSYLGGGGYFPKGGNVTIDLTPWQGPNFYDVVDP